MSLDLEFDDGQLAIAEAVATFCSERCDDAAVKGAAGRLPLELWRELAELGVLGVALPEEDGGALEIVAAVESLGHAAFPGPLAGTFLATQVLTGAERDDVVAGRSIVSAGVPPLLPFAQCAQVFLAIDGNRVFRARPVGEIEPAPMLGGEPWGRVVLEREQELPDAKRGIVLSQLVLAAQVAAMGERLVRDASAHATTRMQFGHPIGDFQAVAHPLADCAMRLAAAVTLARAAAFRFDQGQIDAAALLSASAYLSASGAGLEAAYVCHQVFGAVGITLEGPVFHLSRRIRQLASQPPGERSVRVSLLGHYGLGPEGAAPEVLL